MASPGLRSPVGDEEADDICVGLDQGDNLRVCRYLCDFGPFFGFLEPKLDLVGMVEKGCKEGVAHVDRTAFFQSLFHGSDVLFDGCCDIGLFRLGQSLDAVLQLIDCAFDRCATVKEEVEKVPVGLIVRIIRSPLHLPRGCRALASAMLMTAAVPLAATLALPVAPASALAAMLAWCRQTRVQGKDEKK